MRNDKPTRSAYSLLDDPVYYGAIVVFATLATLLPALLGATWFMVFAQTLALWLLLLVPLRRNKVRRSLVVLAIWLPLQALTIFISTLITPNTLEKAVGDGFRYHESLLSWLYAGTALPASWFSQPLLHLLEVLGVLLGALASGGLVGVWFLTRTVNLYAFGAAVLLHSAGGIAGLMAALQPWLLLRIVSYAGLLPLFALPGFNGAWWPGSWSPGRRRLFIGAGALLLAALLLELFLPGLWSRWFGPLAAANA